MAQALTLLLAALAGASAGWIVARRRSPASAWPGSAPGLVVSEASLDWLRAMLGARAVWALSARAGEEADERLTSGDLTLAAHDVAAVEHRLAEARRGGRASVERLGSGTLVLRPRSGAVTAALLPASSGGAGLDVASVELDRLLDALERRPRLAAMARAEAQPGHLESLESVSHRLAFELESLTGGDVIVAITLPTGLTVMGLGGAPDARLEGAIAPPDSPLARAVLDGGTPLHTTEPPLGWRAAERRSQERPAVLLLLEQDGEHLGGVVIWPRGAQLPAAILAHAEAAVRRAGPRVSRACEAYALRSAASRDPLTGLANRRQLQLAMHDARTTAGALVLLDIDHFKRLNDGLGHPAGDDALLHVAGILRHQTRTGDLVARIGGEEFALWLPNTSLAAAAGLAERIRATLERSAWTWQGAPWGLSASFGVAHWGETTAQVDNLMAQADAALYLAKQGGRNRVRQAD